MLPSHPVFSALSVNARQLENIEMLNPTFDEFSRKARDGNLIPVYREILADMETPVSAFRKIDSGNYAFLLESVEGGEKWGRYSFLGSNPSLVFRAKGEHLEIRRGEGRQVLTDVTAPLTALRRILERSRAVRGSVT